jgi:RNA polymerase sigma-70 factor (ECF subfamily)
MIEFADGRIMNFYAMRNPEKLAAVTVRREISR